MFSFPRIRPSFWPADIVCVSVQVRLSARPGNTASSSRTLTSIQEDPNSNEMRRSWWRTNEHSIGPMRSPECSNLKEEVRLGNAGSKKQFLKSAEYFW
jgi:hypothetical protein